MQKIEVINNISAKSGIPKIDVRIVLDEFFKEIHTQMLNKENVYLSNFGYFGVKNKPAKRGGNKKVSTHRHTIHRLDPNEFMPVFVPCEGMKKAVSDKFDTKRKKATEQEKPES